MPTPDPIALPEPRFGEWLRGIYASEKNPHRDGMYVRTIHRDGRLNPGKYYEVTDGKGDFWTYLAEGTTRVPATGALTPAPQVPADAVLRFLNHLEDVMDAHPEVADWVDVRLWNAISTPKSEPFGNAEELASLEQRARHVEVLRAIGSAFEGIPSPCEERGAVDAAIAALSAQPADWYQRRETHAREMGYAGLAEALDDLESRRAAQPRGVEVVAEYQYRCPKALDKGWRRMTQQEYEATIATGHACGNVTWTRDVEVRKLYAAPQPHEVMSEAVAELPADATAQEVVDHFLHIGRTMRPVGQWPGERVYAAIERAISQPRDFICPICRSPERCHNGRGGDSPLPLPPYRPDRTTPQDAAGVEATGWLHEIQWTDGWGSPKYRHGPTKPPAHLDVVQYPELVRPTVVSERFTPVYATTPPPGVDVGKLRADARDAERYRWLKAGGYEHSDDGQPHIVIHKQDDFGNWRDQILEDDEADAAIDAAAPATSSTRFR